MNKKLLIVTCSIVLALLIILGIVHSRKPVGSQKKISIGLILPMTDFLQSYGENARKGAEAALAGTANVSLDIQDDKCVTAPALSTFQKLTEVDHADLIIGPLCGSPQRAGEQCSISSILLKTKEKRLLAGWNRTDTRK